MCPLIAGLQHRTKEAIGQTCASNRRRHRALVDAPGSVRQRGTADLSRWGRRLAGRHKHGDYCQATSTIARRIAWWLWPLHRLGEQLNLAKYTFGARVSFAAVEIADVLPRRWHALLKEHKVSKPQELAETYTQGPLAMIGGFGELTVQPVRCWPEKERAAATARRVDCVFREPTAQTGGGSTWESPNNDVRKGRRRCALARAVAKPQTNQQPSQSR